MSNIVAMAKSLLDDAVRINLDTKAGADLYDIRKRILGVFIDAQVYAVHLRLVECTGVLTPEDEQDLLLLHSDAIFLADDTKKAVIDRARF